MTWALAEEVGFFCARKYYVELASFGCSDSRHGGDDLDRREKTVPHRREIDSFVLEQRMRPDVIFARKFTCFT